MKPHGAILYRGPSALDGKPIVAILTHITTEPANRKIGDMAQLWIIPDPAEWDSVATLWATGQDSSVCGSCPHRGAWERERWRGRSCYVSAQPISAVARTYRAGVYVDASATPEARAWAIYSAVRGRWRRNRSKREASAIRWGAYGDPLAIPRSVLEPMLQITRELGTRSPGYTHQWREPENAWARDFLMASVERPEDRALANAAGWHCFRADAYSRAPATNEVHCPADSGRASGCDDCGLCSGANGARDVWIPVHGYAGIGNARANIRRLPVVA